MKNKPTNTRTRSGCLTCRDRHMKCDEGLPICNNCKKLNRKCVRGLRLNFIQYLTYDPQEIGKQRLENIHIYNHRIIDQLITIASLYKNGLHNYKPFLKYHTKEQLQEANVHFHELFKKFENKTNSITNTTFYKNSMDVSDIMKSSTSTQFENSDSTNRWYKRNPIDTNSHVLSYQSIKNQQRRPTVEDYNRQMVYGTQALYRDTGSYPVQNQPGTLSKPNVYEKENPAHYSSSITRLSYNPQAASNWRQESDPTAALGSNTPLFSNHPRSSSDQFYSSVSHNSSRSQNLSLENASFNMNNDFIGFNTNSFLLRQLSSESHDQSTLTERSISNVNQGINWFADLFNDLQIWESIIPVYLNQVGIQNVLMKLGMTRLLESFSYYNSLIPNVDFKTTMLKAHHAVKLQMRDINKVQEIIDLQDRLVNQFGPSSHTEVLFSVVTLLMELLIIICQLELCNGQLRKVSLDGNSNSDTYDVNAIFLQQIQVFNSIHNQLHTPQNQLTQAILTSLIHLVIILKFVLSIKISGKVLPLNNLELNLLKNPSNYDYRVYTRDVLYRDMSINKDQHNILGTEQFKHSSISDNASNKTLGGHYTDSFLLCNQFWSVIRSFYTQSEEYQYRFDEEMQFDVTQMAPNLVAPQNFDPFKHVMSDRVLAILILLQEETKTTKSHMNDISNNYIRSMLYSGQLHYINEQEMKNVWHIYFNWTVE